MFLKLWHCQIMWYLFVGFKTITLCSVHCCRSWNMCFLLKYDPWKLQLYSWNMNPESLDQTLIVVFLMRVNVFRNGVILMSLLLTLNITALTKNFTIRDSILASIKLLFRVNKFYKRYRKFIVNFERVYT